MLNTTSLEKEKGNGLSQMAMENLESIEGDIELSSAYFKPKANKIYIIKVDLDQHPITVVTNDRFKDAKGNPIKRYQLKIVHVNFDKEQLWEVSKTVCLDIIKALKQGFSILKITRHGEDRGTTYDIEGVK